MIFKTLFRPKYQDPSAKVRIKAIDNLDPQNAEQKSILHELAFNDGDISVNLAALEKLDSFVLWCKTYQTSNQERIRKQAQKRVEEVLFDESADKISSRDRLTFIKECRHIPLLEKLVKLDWLQTQHADLLPKLLDRIGKPHVEQTVFNQTQSEALQSLLVQRLDNISELQKALKKALSEAVKQQIEDKVEQLHSALEKPKTVLKDVTLVLSKLNALRDNTDYELLKSQFETLQREFGELSTQFSCLDTLQQQSLHDKYAQIVTRLEQQIQTLYPAWQTQNQAKVVARAWQKLKADCANTVEQLRQSLASQDESIGEEQLSKFSTQVQELQATFAQLQTTDARVPESESQLVRQQLLGVKETLVKLPQMQHAVQAAKQLLEKFKQQQEATAELSLQVRKQSLADLEQEYRSLRAGFSELWPTNLQTEFKRLKTEGSQAITAIKQELKQRRKRVESKLSATQRFIDGGKFKVAMKVFDEARRAYEDFADDSAAVLERRFERVKEQVINLQQWQEYIATPRKPKLLEQAQSLAKEPFDIDKQAKAVKELRQQWQSLGTLSSEEDDRLNREFDQAIEKAFEPCRRHYEQLERERQENFASKQAIIEKIESLQRDPRAVEEKINEFMVLKNQFKTIGHVDHSLFKTIQQHYAAATEPMNQAIKLLHQDNTQQKLQLIQKAQGLAELDDVEQAVEQAKSLQQRWKQIGSVGKKQEQKLWNEFRDANDKIFAKRKAQQTELEQASQARWLAFEEQLNALSDKIEQQQEQAGLQPISAEFDGLESLISDFDAPWQNKAKARISGLRSAFEHKLKQLTQAKDQLQWQTLFALLKKRQEGGALQDSELSSLPKAWQQWFSGASDTGKTVRELVVTLEILKNAPSPAKDDSLRQQIQLQLMSQKLQHGEQPDELALLAEFVSAGVLDKSDAALIDRMKSLWLEHTK